MGVLDTHLFMLESWNVAHKSKIIYKDNPWCKEWPHHPSIPSGTFNVLPVWLQGRGVLDTLIFIVESWNLAHKSRIRYHDNPWCKEWPHPLSIQSGTCNILQVWRQGCGVLDALLIMLKSWNLAPKSKITYDDPWYQIWYLYIHFKLCLSLTLSISGLFNSLLFFLMCGCRVVCLFYLLSFWFWFWFWIWFSFSSVASIFNSQ